MFDSHPLLLSLEVSLLATCISSVAAIATAALLSHPRTPARHVLDALVTSPMVIPPTVLGYYLLVVLGRRSPVGQIYEATFGEPIVFTKTGAVVAASVACFPLVVKAARAAIEAVEPVMIQAARVHGAGAVRTFFVVVLPLSSRGILAGVMLGFARALGDFGMTLMVAGNVPGETQTAPLAIYDAIASGRDGDAATSALILAMLAFTIMYAVNRASERARR